MPKAKILQKFGVIFEINGVAYVEVMASTRKQAESCARSKATIDHVDEIGLARMLHIGPGGTHTQPADMPDNGACSTCAYRLAGQTHPQCQTCIDQSYTTHIGWTPRRSCK